MKKNNCEINAYVTVLCNDNYIYGVIALAESLIRVKSAYKLYVLCTYEVSKKYEKQIRKMNVGVIRASDIHIDDSITLNNTGDYQKWNRTFFKLNVMALTQFQKIVVLDADMIVRRNIDHLFICPHMSCVAAGKMLRENEVDGINSGLMVIEPSQLLYKKLISAIVPTKKRLKDKPMGDQDVFQTVYPDWEKHTDLQLHEKYNCYNTDVDKLLSGGFLQYNDICVLHYAMVKPWMVHTFFYPIQILHTQRVVHGNYDCKYQVLTYLLWWKYYLGGRMRLLGGKNEKV